VEDIKTLKPNIHLGNVRSFGIYRTVVLQCTAKKDKIC